jgi:hypothetical protein
MFDNIGDKIKSSARTSFILWTIVAVISGIVLMFEESFVVGLLVALVGPGFLLGFFQLVYGFGQLVENSDIIAEEHKRVNEKHEKAVAKNNEKKQAQRKKQIKANIENPNFDEDEYIDITCANCKAELSFTKGQLQSGEELTCPMCDAHISV